jgi:hypothetical protein
MMSKQTLIEYMITELDARRAAELRVGQQSREDRVQDARMSDDQLARKRADEIRARQKSEDPIDRQIAALQAKIDLLLQKQAQQRAMDGEQQQGAAV